MAKQKKRNTEQGRRSITPDQRAAIEHEFSSFFRAISFAVMTAKFYDEALLKFCETLGQEENDDEMDDLGGQHVDDTTEGNQRHGEGERRSWIDPIGLLDTRPFIYHEAANHSPKLYGMILISMWGVAEAKIDDIAMKMLLTFPELLDGDDFSKLTGNLVEFSRLSRGQAVLHLYNEFKH